jgi:hypothetical protein
MLCQIACEVPLSLRNKSALRYVKSRQNWRKTMTLEERSRIGSGYTCFYSVQNVACSHL